MHVTLSPTEAARALADGRLAVLPTETVYGLGALADGPAVRRIFEVKGRPAWHPLIVHVSSPAALEGTHAWTRDVPDYAWALTAAYWPGPLTVVLRRSPRVSDAITGGQDTVAVRCPSHPLAHTVLRMLDAYAEAPAGVAAPSANRHGAVSPTTAQHVVADLGPYLGADDVILDGGACDIGVESTIVDCTGAAPRLLRPGSIAAAEIALATGLAIDLGESEVRAPGGLAAHYAPRARVRVVTAADLGALEAGTGLIALDEVATPGGLVRLAAPHSIEEYAHDLYAALREADARGLTDVVAVPPSGESGLAAAVRDRLSRAAAS